MEQLELIASCIYVKTHCHIGRSVSVRALPAKVVQQRELFARGDDALLTCSSSKRMTTARALGQLREFDKCSYVILSLAHRIVFEGFFQQLELFASCIEMNVQVGCNR